MRLVILSKELTESEGRLRLLCWMKHKDLQNFTKPCDVGLQTKLKGKGWKERKSTSRLNIKQSPGLVQRTDQTLIRIVIQFSSKQLYSCIYSICIDWYIHRCDKNIETSPTSDHDHALFLYYTSEQNVKYQLIVFAWLRNRQNCCDFSILIWNSFIIIYN